MENAVQMELTLMEGKIIRCALVTRHGIALKIPKFNAVKYLKNQPEDGIETCRGKACVYLLLGVNPENQDERWVYIGETTDIVGRVSNHCRDPRKEFCNEIIVFFRTDKVLNKGTAIHVENELIQKAREAGHYVLDNKPRNSETTISNFQAPVAQDFVKSIEILASSLGYQIFEAPGEAQRETGGTSDGDTVSPVFTMKYKGAEATGRPSTGGFVVFKGSSIVSEPTDSCPSWTKSRRGTLSKNLVIVDNRFVKDHEFKSPCAAAGVVSGSSITGLDYWKLPNGTSLKDYQVAEVGSITSNDED